MLSWPLHAVLKLLQGNDKKLDQKQAGELGIISCAPPHSRTPGRYMKYCRSGGATRCYSEGEEGRVSAMLAAPPLKTEEQSISR